MRYILNRFHELINSCKSLFIKPKELINNKNRNHLATNGQRIIKLIILVINFLYKTIISY